MNDLTQYPNPFVNGSSPSDTGYWMLPEGMTYQHLPEPVPGPRLLPTVQCQYCTRAYIVDKAPDRCEGCGASLGLSAQYYLPFGWDVPQCIISLPQPATYSWKDDIGINLFCTLLLVGSLAFAYWSIFLR
jgi:hypothetical protein